MEANKFYRPYWWFDSERILHRLELKRIKRFLKLARKIDKFSKDPAQTGWWLICRHFRLDTHSLYPGNYFTIKGHSAIRELCALARDDFLNGSQKHRLVTPQNLLIPPKNSYFKQILNCPWYLLQLPSHPTLADKRHAKSQKLGLETIEPARALKSLLQVNSGPFDTPS